MYDSPDYKLQDAREFIETLDASENYNGLILYYISDLKNQIANQKKQLDKYHKFFEDLFGLIPRHDSNPILR